MESILRAAAIYLFLLLLFRVNGKRSLQQITTFDFILLLIISEATQQALLGDDFSITNACLSILTLVGIDIGLSLVKQRSRKADRILDDLPLLIVEDGKPIEERMRKERVDASDVLAAAREAHGLESLDEVRYAVLERSGGISIVPRERKR